MLNQKLFTLIGNLSDPGHRPQVVREIAQMLGADDLIIFSKDPILNILLPAPGFPQTLPQGQKWRRFLGECLTLKPHVEELISPYSKVAVSVTGVMASDGSVLALLGGQPNGIQAVDLCGLIPLVVAALFNEKVAVVARGEIEAEILAFEKTRALAAVLDVSRRDLESALRKTTSILKSITDAFLGLDRHWQVVDLNPQGEVLLKVKKESILDRNFWELYPDAIHTNLYQHYHDAMLYQKSVTFQEYFPLWQAWYEVRVYPSREGLAVYFTDINERVRAAEELRQSQEWFRTTLQSIGDGVIAINVDRTVTFLNPVAESLTGWTLAEAAGKLMSEVFRVTHDKTNGLAFNSVEAVLMGRKNVGVTDHTTLIHRSGQKFIIEDSASPIVDKTGKIIGVVLVFRDVTEKYAHRENLKLVIAERDRSLDTLSTINEVGQRLTAELDLEKLVQQVTDAATRLAGAEYGVFFYKVTNDEDSDDFHYAFSGISEETFVKFIEPKSVDLFDPVFLGSGTVCSDDMTQDSRYNKSIPHQAIFRDHLGVKSYLAVSVVSRSGEVLGGLFFGHTKTAIFNKSAQSIVEGLASQAAVAMDNARLYRRIRESVHARDEFLSVASHELKTPLTSLNLQMQIRAKSLNTGGMAAFTQEALREMIEADRKQLARLSGLIDDMLDIARISTGRLRIRAERFDLCVLIQEVMDRYQPQFQSVGSRATLILCAPLEGTWDRFRIEQVITNLLSNAIRYGEGRSIEVSLKKESNQAVLTVRDEGIGIAKENHKRIFERLERAMTAKDINGLGLGLYIVRNILEMHHGKIRVESELGKGATFIVDLPL